jgi:pantoate--beta-alanine ligase
MALSVHELTALQSQLMAWRQEGLTIGFVPTMGGLHDGHCSLMRQATQRCDRLVVSIFVNPAQFAEGEDLESYPRDAESDLALATSAGADLVWFPKLKDIYPDGWCSTIVPSGVGLELETDHRPHFFTGVATVVARLFALIRPQIAVFGEKDYQQLLVVRQLNKDLCFGVEVLAGRLVRDRDGLALSSRNVYLSPEARADGQAVPRALAAVCAAYAQGERSVAPLEAAGVAELRAIGLEVEYCRIVSAHDLSAPPDSLSGDADDWRLVTAARCHGIRLIDNCALDDPPWR